MDGEITIVYVEPRFIIPMWDEVAPLIEKAMKYGTNTHSINDILNLLLDKSFQLVVVFKGETIQAAAVTEVIQYPQAKHMRVDWMGGENMAEWIDKLVDYVEQGAKNVGATHIELIGRPGWKKIFKGQADTEYITLNRKVKE